MERVVAAFEARRSLGKLLQDVLARGDRFVVERHGEPVAAVVPIEVYEQWKRSREVFFRRMEEAAARANLSEEEAEALVGEAVRAVRASPSK
jgi:prevent-host-death family protein